MYEYLPVTQPYASYPSRRYTVSHSHHCGMSESQRCMHDKPAMNKSNIIICLYGCKIPDSERSESKSPVFGLTAYTNIKGTFRDHSRDNALNFHQIRDLCILVKWY